MPFSALNPPPVKQKKMHEKTILKLKLLARLELQNLGMTDAGLALHLGVKTPVVVRLKRLKIYHQIKSQLVTGLVSDMDDSISNNYNLNKKLLRSAVPTALENLVALASQKMDKGMQLKASQEILDREGSFSKVSRQNVVVTDNKHGFATDEDNAIADEILQVAKAKHAINNPAQAPTIETPPSTESVQ